MKKEKLQCNGTGSKSYHRQHELLEKETKAKYLLKYPLMLMQFNSMLIKVDGIFLKKEYSTSISIHVVIYHPL